MSSDSRQHRWYWRLGVGGRSKIVTVTAAGTRGTLGAPPQSAGYLEFIDGVRTIAVVSVLLFHADRLLLPGGFVGVDIFFVISGFLITRICMSDKFAFASFYFSRARRILPAYFATLIVTGLVSLAVLLPQDLVTSASSLGAGSLLLQNFVFWKQFNYFSPANDLNPYLHTWSLAVEWQFYLFLPCLVRAFRTRLRSLLVALSIVFMLSLVASAYGAIYKPTPTFFLMPFRVWEFLVGSFVALVPAGHITLRRFGGVLSLLGVAMVSVSILIFDESLPFPGLSALLPCLGTGAILAGGISQPRAMVSRALSLGPVRLVGQASYSIYLVHWPIFVFVRYILIDREGPEVTAALLALSFALGFLSWRFVEQSFRKPGALGAARRWLMSGMAIALTAGIAVLALVGHGFPQRLSPAVRNLAAAANDSGEFRECLENEPPKTLQKAECHFGVKGKGDRPSVVLWGDSFSAALADGLHALASERGRTGVFFGTDSCPPLQGLDSSFRQAIPRCRRLQKAVPELLRSPVDLLIVHASWAGHRRRNAEAFDDAVRRSFPDYKRMARRVVIVGASPGARLPVPGAMARAEAFGRTIDLRPSPANLAAIQKVNRFLSEQARANGYVFVDTMPYLCRNACNPFVDGMPLYFDYTHIRATTSRSLAHAFANVLIPAEQ